MKNIISLLLIVVTLSGCGTFRKVFKLKESDRTEEQSEVKIDLTSTATDRSVTTITEKKDTTITTKQAVVKQDTYLNKDSLVKGMVAIHNDLVDVKLKLDPVTGILSTIATVKPQLVPVNIDKTTRIEADVKQDIAIAQQKNSSIERESKRSTVEKEPAKIGVWFAIAALVVLVLGLLAWLRFR